MVRLTRCCPPFQVPSQSSLQSAFCSPIFLPHAHRTNSLFRGTSNSPPTYALCACLSQSSRPSVRSRRSLLKALAAAAATCFPGADAQVSAFNLSNFLQKSKQDQTGSNGSSNNSTPSQVPAYNARDAKIGFTVYEVKNLEDVTLSPVGFSEALDYLGNDNVDAVFLGEHHWSFVDHTLQAKIIEALKRKRPQRPMAIFLEMVQHQFQPVLDEYIKGSLDELELYTRTEWDTRWVWPFEQYLPVFRIARKLGIPLLAMSADTEQLSRAQARDLSSLSELASEFGGDSAFQRLSSRDPGFQAYVNINILPSYATHARAGLLTGKPSFDKFYRQRLLRDAAMAVFCDRYLSDHPETLIVCLLGIDHVKFGQYGVPGRLIRRVTDRIQRDQPTDVAATAEGASVGPILDQRPWNIRTVLLNPAASDAFDDRNGSLMLDFPVQGGSPVQISDLLWFSSGGAEAVPDPRRRQPSKRIRTRHPAGVLPQVEDLVF